MARWPPEALESGTRSIDALAFLNSNFKDSPPPPFLVLLPAFAQLPTHDHRNSHIMMKARRGLRSWRPVIQLAGRKAEPIASNRRKVLVSLDRLTRHSKVIVTLTQGRGLEVWRGLGLM